MYNKKLHRPTRYSPQGQHNAFGLQNWFILVGVPVSEHDLQQEIMNNFCFSHGWQPDIKKTIADNLPNQIAFIHKRFDGFAKWAHKNYKLKPIYSK